MISRLLICETAIAALLSGCSTGAQTATPSADEALLQIREQVEGQRQCAPLILGSWPIELSEEALAGPRIDALVDAGLVRREPIVVAGQERARVRITLTDMGRQDVWLRRLDPGMPAEPLLCYGRKKVVAVRTERGDAGSEVGGSRVGQILRYDYRIVRSPAWTTRPDIKVAFPFLDRELGRIHTARQAATLSDHKWSLSTDTGSDTAGELSASQGFFPD